MVLIFLSKNLYAHSYLYEGGLKQPECRAPIDVKRKGECTDSLQAKGSLEGLY